ncbi:MAG: YHS domain-containing (seleno)protein [Wenzhouxiangellaceae bacterium]
MINIISKPIAMLLLTGLLALSAAARADQVNTSSVGVSGYDLVSYHTAKRPLRGNGHFVAEHDGVTYLFATGDNLRAFQADPQRYVPAYGGYCAYGVTKGKKFIADPEVWEIVDGRLYLNLDNRVKSAWVKDIPGHIREGDAQWREIKDVAPGAL